VFRESPTAVQTAYESGRGVHRDYKQAHTRYRKAADQNLSAAEKEVGYFYQSGLGVKRDYAQTLTWYRRAAGHGNSDAENQLGWMYQFGQGIEPDDAKALTWYGLAADQGNIHPAPLLVPLPLPEAFLITPTPFNLHKCLPTGGFLQTTVSDAPRTMCRTYLHSYKGAHPIQRFWIASGDLTRGGR
jgi:hypothetical protein